MSLHWFRLRQPDSADALLAALEPLGVRLRKPYCKAFYYQDAETGAILKDVGTLTVHTDGQIKVWPRRDITARELARLLAAAELAFKERPTTASGWLRRRTRKGSYWHSAILLEVRLDGQDPVGAAIALHARAPLRPAVLDEEEFEARVRADEKLERITAPRSPRDGGRGCPYEPLQLGS